MEFQFQEALMAWMLHARLGMLGTTLYTRH